ncbi:hypothetical protein TRFO_31570 [Tritrichomonas foetus]|uniref:Uncharacterized protein n=1 Tax=Tritrichomonas foetus TaxID=1144522 RepID=A0A1J4JVJ0_9EUKA|nr:hypothetical protein TRFO_31570 [Tritrichomonas foetus]|eukprot:OHT01542.1 hypothetical protein TRFO_31570 [Tritrichomonas foetus]
MNRKIKKIQRFTINTSTFLMTEKFSDLLNNHPDIELEDVLKIEMFQHLIESVKSGQDAKLMSYFEANAINLLDTAILSDDNMISDRAYHVIRAHSQKFYCYFLQNRNLTKILNKLVINSEQRSDIQIGRYLEILRTCAIFYPEETIGNLWCLNNLLKFIDRDVTYLFFSMIFKLGPAYQKWMVANDFYIALLNSLKEYQEDEKKLSNIYLLISEFLSLNSFRDKCTSPFRISKLIKIPKAVNESFLNYSKMINHLYCGKTKKEFEDNLYEYVKFTKTVENPQIKVNFMNLISTIIEQMKDIDKEKEDLYDLAKSALLTPKNEFEIQKGLEIYLTLIRNNINSEKAKEIFIEFAGNLKKENKPIHRIACFRICSLHESFKEYCGDTIMKMRSVIESDFGEIK